VPGELRHLERVVAAADSRELIGGPDHPMRKVTEAAAFDDGSWTAARAGEVEALFDGLAPDWNTRIAVDPLRFAPIDDAFARGGVTPTGIWLDVGCGTAVTTHRLGAHVDRIVGFDLSREMLRQAPEGTAVAQADSAALPVPSGCAAVIVLMNAFLFPAEMDRVLAADGVLLWISARGDDTPIYLPPPDALQALPGRWSGVWAEAGNGTWAAFRRAT
jgi:predicted TPR repeat methyltransferase